MGQNTVFSLQRNQIRHRAQRDQIQKGGPFVLSKPQRLQQFKSDTHTGQVLKGIGAARLFRVQHRRRRGKNMTRFVVICHDYIQPKPLGVSNFIYSRNTAIHRNHKARFFSQKG